jgi:hypothetical protein
MTLARTSGEDYQAPFRWVPLGYRFREDDFESGDGKRLSNEKE